ncbi:unnamed protein product [Lecanosticta acicola]|uniref:Unnamed protein product n=1 Tax=Lecanosticta acicola TaxID=111012 RepID=A0AAI8YXR2_9PEZI|nr:unnamed protein product [Lecanosticta acicola]
MPQQPKTQWLFYAIVSGCCAALNGVFAKLTTTQLTTTWATAVSHLFGMQEPSIFVEYPIRGFFFAMNLAFNAVMWGLFTRALTLASSTVRVSVINTSANFVITAILGAIIFSEALPGLWWLGASMLVAGSVVIGSREEGNEDIGAAGTAGAEPAVAASDGYADEPDAPPPSAVGSTSKHFHGSDGAYRDSIDEEIELKPAQARRKREDGESDDEI